MKSAFCLFLILSILAPAALNCETGDAKAKIIYQNPKPGTEFANPGHNITFRIDNTEAQVNPQDFDVIVTGQKSGQHAGNLIKLNANTYSFKKEGRFAHGEKASVQIFCKDNIISEYTFRVKPFTPGINPREVNRTFEEALIKAREKNPAVSINAALPDGIPELRVIKKDNPTDGYFIFDPFNIPNFNRYPEVWPSMLICDNYGTPVFFRRFNLSAWDSIPGAFTDFKLQPNGQLTHGITGRHFYIVLDSSYKEVKRLKMGNGFEVDFHGIQILPGGNYLMMAYPVTRIDFRGLFEDGKDSTFVVYAVIQELDQDGNVLFEWNSLDHIEVTELSDGRAKTDGSTYCDYVHINSVEKDSANSYLMSFRHLDQIIRINADDGEIIWRMGTGKKTNINLVSEVEGEEPGFYVQHDARRLPNGNITLFDNGDKHEPSHSRALEFVVDEETMTATLVRVDRTTPDSYGNIMGSVQTLEDGSKIVGWGSGRPNITEFNPDGGIAFELDFSAFNYRGFKFPWETNIFSIDKKEIDFPELQAQEEMDTNIIVIRNQSEDTININKILNNFPDVFSCNDFIPIELYPEESHTFTIEFHPQGGGEFEDVFTFCQDSEWERIAVQAKVKGSAIEPVSVDEEHPAESPLMNFYPNPAKGGVKLHYELKEAGAIDIKIVNLLGETVYEVYSGEKKSGRHSIYFSIAGIRPGAYYLSYSHKGGKSLKKMIIK